MLNLRIGLPTKSALSVLCLGAHSDDIEIGCGGTVLSLLQRHESVDIAWVVFGAHNQRATEARESAEAFLAQAKGKDVVIKPFRDGFFPFDGAQIKEEFEALKRRHNPDLIFTHYRDDRHQDHRLISDLTWNTFRNHMILEYEIPKYDGDLGQPNFFVPLDEETCAGKIRRIMENFASQRGKQWFDEDTFRAMLRIRGMEANAPSRYAEAFYCRKAVLT
jgi:LmbE family N-acetylglucosaminyl deacetylase